MEEQKNNTSDAEVELRKQLYKEYIHFFSLVELFTELQNLEYILNNGTMLDTLTDYQVGLLRERLEIASSMFDSKSNLRKQDGS